METIRRCQMLGAVCALVVGLSAAAPARVFYVDDDATGANGGSCWVNAFTHLQQALSVAGAGDEIRVAQGFYRPDQGLPPSQGRPRPLGTKVEVGTPGSPYATFQLKNGVALRGGFAGITADDPNVRDERRYQTILTGDLNGNDQEVLWWGNPLCEFLQADNSLHVVESTGTDSTAVLDGVVIESAVESGLVNLAGSPSIANCIFRNSSARYARGGGLHCEGGRLTLSSCMFETNLSGSGGAIFATGADLTLLDCHFSRNWGALEGGAICCIDADLALSRCTLELNGALEGGAIHQTGGTLTLVECTFETNAADRGGAAAFAAETVLMTRCVFARNWALREGGALENAGAPLTLDECTFSGNAAAEGGALYAFRLTSPLIADHSGTTVTSCLFTGNRALSIGGALHSAYVELTIHGCTFAGNWAPTAGGTLSWLALRAEDAPYQLRMDNCIVWDGEGSMMPLLASRSRTGTLATRELDVVARYSDVQGGWPGDGNIDADPCFAAPGHWVDGANPKIVVDPSYANAAWVEGDYHLKSQAGRWGPAGEDWVLDEVTSPCIDAGDPNSPVGDEPQPNGGRINLGAYGGTAEASKSR
jgi:hypothetical protein